MSDTRFDPTGIGVWTEPDHFEVTADRVIDYAAATNDPIAVHRSGVVAPPLFAAVPVFNSFAPAVFSIIPPHLLGRMVHGAHDIRFHRTIQPGDVLLSRAKPVGYHGKAQGTAGVVYTETRTESGVLVNEQWATMFFRGFDAGETVGALAPNHRFDDELYLGTPDIRVLAHVDEDQTYRYASASGDPIPIHTDPEAARLAGLPGIIAHGLCTMAFTSWAILTEIAASDVEKLHRLAVRFAKPVQPGQNLTTDIWQVDTHSEAHTYAYRTCVDDTVVIEDGLAEIKE